MLPLVIVLSVAVLALALVVAWQHDRLRTLTGSTDPADHVSEARGPTAPGRDVILIDIQNDVDLAANRVSIARTMARFTPGLIRSLVHRETVRMIATQLTAEGVVANVRVVRLAPHVAAAVPAALVTVEDEDDGEDQRPTS